ncbi:M23 family peptidase [Nakamurella antarctica]|uniref:M23 family peptidase n=2 Tax=Nakamurella antarctica TaxID=1902245 RepID=A0A3G8ZZK7_9ACTN|nr:M23 family peptidase [Nakamurella antarctica]
MVLPVPLPDSGAARTVGDPLAWQVPEVAKTSTSDTGFRWPLAPIPPVLTLFLPPTQEYGPGHRGVDLGGAPQDAVLAANAGKVVYAGNLAGRGVVSVEHSGGLRTTYEPVTASVIAGSMVEAGEQIGVLERGHAKCAPASCLHWGAKIGGTYLDPTSLLAPLRIRLKPWDGLVDTQH